MESKLTTSRAKDGVNLTFSSGKEIESYIRGRIGNPGYSASGGENMLARKSFDGEFLDSSGVDVVKQISMTKQATSVAYRLFLNPVDYEGQIVTDMKAAYRTNELGFAIGVMFFMALGHSFLKFRKNAIMETKKRFAFQ